MQQRYQFGLATAGGGGQALGRTLVGAGMLRREGLGTAQPRRHRPPPGLVVDLGLGIGSPDWWRGLASCVLLCVAAAFMAPDMSSLAVPAPAAWGDAEWDEARTLGFAPLAFGGDSGNRMAATDAVEAIEHAPERPTIDLLATLGRGDSLARVLERSGVGGREAAEASALVAGVASGGDIRPGTPMDVRLGQRSSQRMARPLERLAFRARFDLNVVVERSGGRLVLRSAPIAVDNTPLRVSGRVGSSLYFSARAAGAPAKAVEAYIRTLSSQLSLGNDVREDDRFDIIVSHRRAANGDTQSGQLLYAGLDRPAGRDLQLLPWTVDGQTRWFEASGVGRTSGSMGRPVSGSISSAFGPRRHPILGFVRMHRGVDFRAGYGQPIYAVTTGQVMRAGWTGGYGNQVWIAHGGGLGSSYSHMSRIVAQPGAIVRQGQVIGYVGSTGLSTGPHLHYELHKNGVPINPMSVRFVTRSVLEGAELQAFRARLHALLGVRSGAPRNISGSGS